MFSHVMASSGDNRASLTTKCVNRALKLCGRSHKIVSMRYRQPWRLRLVDDLDGDDGHAGEDHDYHEEHARLEEAAVPWLVGRP